MKATEIIVLITVLIVLVVVAVRMRTVSRMHVWCDAIPVGATRSEVINRARGANLEVPSDTNDKAFGVRLGLFPVGFAICTVTFDNDAVVSKRYETS